MLQKARVDAVKSGRDVQSEEADLADWQIEIITAIVEALNREIENEEVGVLEFLKIFVFSNLMTFDQFTVLLLLSHSSCVCRLIMRRRSNLF